MWRTLGDSLIAYSKMFSKFQYNLKNLDVTHVEVPNILLKSIKDFYKSQEINANIINISNWNWIEENKNKFEYIIADASWCANENNSMLFNAAFPKIEYTNLNKGIGVDIIIHPAAGRSLSRIINIKNIQQLIDKYPKRIFHLVGWSNNSQYNNLKGAIINHLNGTSMQQFINLICSCNIFIGHAGFGVYLAGMANKKVFAIPELHTHRLDPRWRLTKINSLEEINL